MGRLKVSRAKLLGAGFDLRSAAVAGAAANTNIAVAGIKKSDELFAVLDATFTDRTATTTIFSDGNIRCTADTSATRLFVIWFSA